MNLRRFRSFLFKVHKFLGLYLALMIGFIFVTGSLLVFADEISVAFHPKVWVAGSDQPDAGFGPTYQTVTTAFPEATLQWTEKRPTPFLADRSYMRTAWNEEIIVWTDPVSGALLDVTRAVDFKRIIHGLHENLLTPVEQMRLLLTSLSFVILIMIVSGLITYRRFWKGLFRIPSRGAGLRGWGGALHRLVGLWCLPFLVVLSLSTTLFFLASVGVNMMLPPAKPAAERAAAVPATLTGAQIAQMEQTAQVAMPGVHFTKLTMPRRARDGVWFEGAPADAAFVHEGSRVVVDPTDGAVLGVLPASAARGPGPLVPLAMAFHYGTWGGTVTRVLWVLFGLGSATLVFAGAVVFAARQTTSPHGMMRRFWRGLGLVRWVYVLAVLGMIAMAVLRYGTPAQKWVGIVPPSQAAGLARLAVKGDLRQGKPLQLRLSLVDDTVAGASVAGRDAVRLTPDNRTAIFRITPQAADNDITVTLTRADGSTQTGTFRLGRAIW